MSTILERIADGDASAVDDALAEYGSLVYRLANRYLDRARGDVDDAVQEVFVELWLKASAYDPAVGGEPAFVATIAHRRLIDYQRRLSARHRAEHRASEARAPGTRNASASESLANLGDRDDLTAAFDALPDAERQALWLSLYAGMTVRQIGLSLDTSPNTIKSRQRRGLGRLWAALKGGAARKGSEASA